MKASRGAVLLPLMEVSRQTLDEKQDAEVVAEQAQTACRHVRTKEVRDKLAAFILREFFLQ